MLTFDDVMLAQGDFRLSVDLSIGPGITAVIGPSGAGKSTLLAAVAGFLAPMQGAVQWAGGDLGGFAPGARPVSMLFQDHNLFPHLTVGQNVGLGLQPNLRLSPADKAAVGRALSQVGLDGFDARLPKTLSGGQQSRVALARVLVADRPVVLLDEPFSALGPAMKAEMLDLVRAVLGDAGKTVVMVTHDPGDAKVLASQVVVVADGRAEGPTETQAVFANPPDALRDYLG
ncbi:MAG: ATP-binding cassette domain-containing protein [Pseudomonadota bacterium]